MFDPLSRVPAAGAGKTCVAWPLPHSSTRRANKIALEATQIASLQRKLGEFWTRREPPQLNAGGSLALEPCMPRQEPPLERLKALLITRLTPPLAGMPLGESLRLLWANDF